MIWSIFRLALVTIIPYVATVSAASGLSLRLSGADRIDDVDNLKIVATIINSGNETLKLLNDPGSLLSKLPTETFSIVHIETGAVPTFSGAQVKYVHSVAAKVGREDAFTVLAPGEHINIQHDLSQIYNFTSSGPGTYTVKAKTSLFFHVGSDGGILEVLADHPDVHTTSISGKLVTSRATPTLEKRAFYNSCSSSQQSLLVAAASAAQSYAAQAYSYLASHTTATTRYTTWFGVWTSARYSIVLNIFANLNSNTFSSYTYDCTCTDSGTFAYVYPDTFGYVYLCGAYWSAPTTGTDSKGGMLICEATQFTRNGGLDSHSYGQAGVKTLAISNPSKAISSCQAYEYFAENSPPFP